MKQDQAVLLIAGIALAVLLFNGGQLPTFAVVEQTNLIFGGQVWSAETTNANPLDTGSTNAKATVTNGKGRITAVSNNPGGTTVDSSSWMKSPALPQSEEYSITVENMAVSTAISDLDTGHPQNAEATANVIIEYENQNQNNILSLNSKSNYLITTSDSDSIQKTTLTLTKTSTGEWDVKRKDCDTCQPQFIKTIPPGTPKHWILTTKTVTNAFGPDTAFSDNHQGSASATIEAHPIAINNETSCEQGYKITNNACVTATCTEKTFNTQTECEQQINQCQEHETPTCTDGTLQDGGVDSNGCPNPMVCVKDQVDNEEKEIFWNIDAKQCVPTLIKPSLAGIDDYETKTECENNLPEPAIPTTYIIGGIALVLVLLLARRK